MALALTWRAPAPVAPALLGSTRLRPCSTPRLVIPGTGVRFGLDALIGLFTVVGDIITTALSLFIVHQAYQLGAPGHVIARMLGNVALDGVFGAVPLVGDAFDVLWRANPRKVRLFREWLGHARRR